MHTKLQELTDKIYAEGVEKARAEAGEILDQARGEAAVIMEKAHAEAERILQEAENKANELKRNVDAEMKLTASQSLSAIKQLIANSITQKVVEPSVKETFGDKTFLQGLIAEVVSGWTKSGNFDLNVILPESEKSQLETFFKNSLAVELNKGVTIDFDKKLKSGFKVGPKDGSYVVSLSEADFENFFKAYLRPKTSALLFEK